MTEGKKDEGRLGRKAIGKSAMNKRIGKTVEGGGLTNDTNSGE